MRYSAKLLSLATFAAILTSSSLALKSNASISGSVKLPTSMPLAQTPEAERQIEADRLFQQGIEQSQLNQFREAIQSWEQALAIYREIRDQTGEGATLWNLGDVYNGLGEYQVAIDYYQQVLVIGREIGGSSSEGEGIILRKLGVAHIELDEYQQAIDLLEQSLAIARELDDLSSEAHILNNIGVVNKSLGNYSVALGYYEQSLFIKRELGDLSGEANTLSNIGVVNELLGNYSVALGYFEQSLLITRELGERAREAGVLTNIGIVTRLLGNYSAALDYHEQSLLITRELGNLSTEAKTLNSIGIVNESLGNYPEALDYYEQSLLITRELGERSTEAKILSNIGSVNVSLGNYPIALDYYEQSLLITRELNEPSGEADVLNSIGIINQRLGNYSEALDHYEQSLGMKRELGDREGQAISLNNKGNVLLDTEQFPQAESSLRQSIDIYESLRTNLSDDQLISIADTQAHTYTNLEWALTAQNKTAEALAITERGRGRAFVLQLASRLADEERAVLEASPAAQVPTVAEIQQIARDTNTTLVTYSLIFDQALYIWVVQPSGDIEFRSVEFDGSGEGGLAINPIAAIDGPVYRSASPDSALTALVTDSRSAVNESGNPNTPQLKELHQVLIDPIADLLPSNPNAQVAFIPQGELFLVPFAALQDDDGTYLIEKHTILTAPSIQVFGLAHNLVETRNFASLRASQGGNALVVGNPTMPTVWLPNDDGDFAETPLSYLSGAQAEAEAIGEFFDIPVLTGAQATEARIKQELPNASLIHLATHGLLEYGIPESSGVLDLPGAVALAPGNGEDGLLTSAEILAMDLQADLAILSACDTGRGRITGDGVVGLSRALITAGVPSVMVSLWAVNDDSTSVLMQRFYEFLATGEFTKAEALRQAQLSLLYAEDVETRLEAVRAGAAPTFREGFEPVGDRHPYHWAPFVLIGNGQ